MIYYAVCPLCGKILFRCESGSKSKIDVQCPKCHENVRVEVTQESVLLSKCPPAAILAKEHSG